MSSAPTTPSTELPPPNQYRFKDTGFPSEWAEDYRPGGFHPVHFGDKFKDDRYRVVRKLGYGSFSTVWLAVDSQDSRFVALKIMRAKASRSSDTELSICSFLAENAPKDHRGKHVVMLLDNFEHTGPNGTHRCLVFDPMGASAASMVDELPCNQPRMRNKTSRYPKAMAKTILRHALSGLAFLHEHSIVHGDMQPGNLLFAISDLRCVNEEQLHQGQSKISEPLCRCDGKSDRWGPKYLALGQSLHKDVDLGPNMTVKLSDLSSAFWEKNPPQSTVTPVALRAPELIFGGTYDSSIDIWAFGCLIYEFLTGTQLFSVFLMCDDELEDADDDHILDLIDVLQPLPETLMSKWPRANKWIGPNGERLQPPERDYKDSSFEGDDDRLASDEEVGDDEHEDGVDDGSEPYPGSRAGLDESSSLVDETDSPPAPIDADIPEVPIINQPLEVQFERNKPDDIDAEEAKVIVTLIREILQYEPSKRPTAGQLLKHPWFQD